MPSIFSADDIQRFIDRIEQLRPDSKPLWGKMTVDQMLAHSQRPLLVACGDLALKRGLIGLLFGKLALKKLLSPGDFDKGLPTAPDFVVKENRNFQAERDALIALLKRFANQGESVLTTQAHPFFGPLNVHEWDVLQTKHLDHHLRQFGV